MELNVNIEIVCEEAKPAYANPGDGGADMRTMDDFECRPGEVVMVKTGVKVEIPYGYAAFLMSRSGHGKLRVTLANSVGLIDHTYRKEVCALITNDGIDPYKAKKFDRVAQLVIVPIVNAAFNGVPNIAEIDRGGFGSTCVVE